MWPTIDFSTAGLIRSRQVCGQRCAALSIAGEDGKTTEWKSQALRAYQRRTRAADALIASCYLSGTNTRRVRRALAAVFAGGVGKDVVSRVWRKVKILWGRAAVKDRVSFGLLLKPKGPRHATD